MLFLPILVFIRGVTNYLSSYCIGWASERMINDMRLDVLEKLSTLSLDFFTRSTTGDLLTRINGDTASLLRCLRSGAADLVKEGVSMISIFCALLWINWKLTLLAMAFVPFCLFPLLVLARKARRAAHSARGGEILQTSQLVELVAGIRIIKAYLLERVQIERYRKISRELVRQGMRGLRAKELTTPLVEVISMLGLGLMLIFIFKMNVKLSSFVGFVSGLVFFFVPVKKLAGVHILFEQAAPGVERLIQILQMQPSVQESPQPRVLKEFRSGITFEGVVFGYAKRNVIRDLTLEIPRGNKVGIAGPSGSGKSTLVNLLFRFYDPRQGAIRIDGINLRELRFQDLRKLLALVSQEVILFDQTVKENILCGRMDATPAEVEAAARAAYAHEFIAQLPQGYDTRVGERGVTLSGGQRQRLAIARAFIRNAPILVLDEATASLDSEAEAEVQRAIDNISENRTVVCVAHRLSTLATCDRVIVMVEGRIVEQGGFQELVSAGGTFAAMARRQGIGAGV
jgi:subfamily B ATP-binding cassette protein MsbA